MRFKNTKCELIGGNIFDYNRTGHRIQPINREKNGIRIRFLLQKYIFDEDFYRNIDFQLGFLLKNMILMEIFIIDGDFYSQTEISTVFWSHTYTNTRTYTLTSTKSLPNERGMIQF